jgi:hypothetical protein
MVQFPSASSQACQTSFPAKLHLPSAIERAIEPDRVCYGVNRAALLRIDRVLAFASGRCGLGVLLRWRVLDLVVYVRG